ncbi:ATP-binding protein [Egicoccus sp. AB-alg2]|uniref:PAS domain-containing sensor histidine kinase n=1 Tax=Egicoccus sp. AB-alg2 TaxID=3242693 RepID=UPI00359D165A
MSAESTSAELLAKLLSSTPDGLLLVDTEGIIQYANPAAERLFERATGTLIGQPFGLPHVVGIRDIELVRDDGSLRTVEMRPIETTWEGDPVWVIALRDTTEQRQDQEQLQIRLQANSELTHELAHELGTTLAVIIGFAGTYEQRWEQLTDEQRRDLFHRIGVHARRIQRMLRRMLLADTTQARPSGPDTRPVELWEVALSHLPDLGVPSVQIDCPRDLRVQADPAYLDEIVINLVENAAKYGAAPITVSARRVGDVVELTVADRGPGVPEDFVPRLFERYARPDETARRTSGSGLGLYLVDKLARALGGSARYEPNQPHGACFVVTLPAA